METVDTVCNFAVMKDMSFAARQAYLRAIIPHVSALLKLKAYFPFAFNTVRLRRRTIDNQYIWVRTVDDKAESDYVSAPTIDDMESFLSEIIPAKMEATELQWSVTPKKHHLVSFQFRGIDGRWTEAFAWSFHKPTALALLLAQLGRSSRFQDVSQSAVRPAYAPTMPMAREVLIDFPTIKLRPVETSDNTAVAEDCKYQVGDVAADASSNDQDVVHRPAAIDLKSGLTLTAVLHYMPSYTAGRALRYVFKWHLNGPTKTDTTGRSIKYARHALRLIQRLISYPDGSVVNPTAVALYRLLVGAKAKDSIALQIGDHIVNNRLQDAIQLFHEQGIWRSANASRRQR